MNNITHQISKIKINLNMIIKTHNRIKLIIKITIKILIKINKNIKMVQMLNKSNKKL